MRHPNEALIRLRALLASRRSAPPLQPGHEIVLLEGGREFFPALELAIDRASRSVRVETYIFNDDSTGRRIAAALARAAARGVSVQVVVDGFGTGEPKGELAERLAQPGLDLRVFRPLRSLWPKRQALRRLHRKLALVDDQTAFIGGINIIDDQEDLLHGRLEAPRFDFALQVRGPLVAPLAVAMRRVWQGSRQLASSPRGVASRLISGGGNVAGGACPPTKDQSVALRADLPESLLVQARQAERRAHRGVRAAFIERNNWRHRRTIERAYLRAIGRARSDVLIACAYFFPGARFRRALAAAAGRGVRVRLLLQGKIEYRLPHFGTLSLYEELLSAGVEIIEYRSSFLHAKLALADQWLTVGSSNIDPFSLLLAREANVVARSAALAAELRAAVERAIAEGGEPVRLAQVRGRPWWLRLASVAAFVVLRVGVALSGKGLRY